MEEGSWDFGIYGLDGAVNLEEYQTHCGVNFKERAISEAGRLDYLDDRSLRSFVSPRLWTVRILREERDRYLLSSLKIKPSALTHPL
jgi:hypothetical protein